MFEISSYAVQQIDVRLSCVCPVIDHEFRHNIVKVAVDKAKTRWFIRSTDNGSGMRKFVVSNRTDA